MSDRPKPDDQPHPTPHPTPAPTPRPGGGQPQSGGQPAREASADEVMAIRKAAGSIAEVIEPVMRTRQERTDR